MRRIVLRTALALAVLLAVAYAAHRASKLRTWQVAGRIVARVETADSLVALTLDDGPTAYTDSVLPVLAARGVRATFFLTGAAAAEEPGRFRRIAAAGHEIGNHSWSHRRMVGRSGATYRREVERTDSLFRSLGYAGPLHFRPPYGAKLVGLPLHLARTGRTTVTWDVEPDSYAGVAATADGITRHVLEETRPGSIVLLHVMFRSRATSRAALPAVIDSLRARGYRFVTVSELLARDTLRR
jgi:peptidoglycan/xylan/chitin deacetylase (PgdA/CDA1 family)